MESLSPDLLARLQALGLCTPRDVRRCRTRVRRLSRDLPAFDCVWLDALVQMGRLTRYQAQVCGGHGPEALRVGPFLLVDRLPADGLGESFTARRPGTKPNVRLTRLRTSEPEREVVGERLQQLADRLRSPSDPRVATPFAVQREVDGIVIVSPPPTGKSLAELLVRRGRFPVSVVWETARRLFAALEHCERCGVLHGDLRLRQVLLTQQGELCLVQPGVLAAVQPRINFHARLPLDVFDGVAPELIDSRLERTIASEMYACGCLLWQLLAGRPPFAAGDPLLKLAAHQTRILPDVRTWAPETPTALAELLARLTRRDPEARPQSFSELVRLAGRPATGPAPRLRRFVRAFQSAAPRSLLPDEPPPRSRARVAVAATGLLLLAAGAWMQVSRGTDWLRFASASSGTVERAAESSPAVADTQISQTVRQAPEASTGARLLPEPQQGVIRLNDTGPYTVRSLSAIGPLTIRGPDDSPAELRISEPWRLTATQVVLQNVVLQEVPGSRVLGPLLEVRAQDFGMINCRLVSSPASPAGSDTPAAFVAWRALAESGGQPGRIGWQQTILLGDRDALHCLSPLTSVQWQQVGYAGCGRVVCFPSQAMPQPVQIMLRHVTVRDAAALVSLSAVARQRPPAVLATLDRCAVSLAADGGLFEFRDAATPAEFKEAQLACRVGGVESWLQNGSRLAVHRHAATATPLDEANMQVEGLQFSQFAFADAPPGDAGRLRLNPPAGWTGALPGCDVAHPADSPAAIPPRRAAPSSAGDRE